MCLNCDLIVLIMYRLVTDTVSYERDKRYSSFFKLNNGTGKTNDRIEVEQSEPCSLILLANAYSRVRL